MTLKLSSSMPISSGLFLSTRCLYVFSVVVEPLEESFEEEDTYSASRLCPECGRKYGTATGLRKHVQSHTRVFKYVCSICSKGFTEKHQLSAHMTKHGHPKLSCDQCKRTFTRPFSLQRHLLTCNNEKGKDDRKVSFACQVCDKTFGQKGTLTTHMEGIHMGLVKYSCELCDKKYKWRTSLSLHVQSKH